MSAIAACSHIICRENYQRQWLISSGGSNLFSFKSTTGTSWIERRKREEKRIGRRNVRVEALWPDLSRPTVLEMEPITDSDHLDQILLNAQQNSQPILIDWYFLFSILVIFLYHGILWAVSLSATAYKYFGLGVVCKVLDAVWLLEFGGLIINWSHYYCYFIFGDRMAAWCRKCIYLKPKLEKLAAEYHNKLKFYCVDVNKVPQSLVKRGNIAKMPTIQLWKDGEMKAEVIGGHKAWMVIEEVREMIQKFV